MAQEHVRIEDPRKDALAVDEPQTPKRYNSLGRRRLPTTHQENHTYERLEDLLREAGYKETRIFTPESNQKSGQDDTLTASPESGTSSSSSTVGAVMGFLTGLVGKPAGEHRIHIDLASQRADLRPTGPASPSPPSKRRTLPEQSSHDSRAPSTLSVPHKRLHHVPSSIHHEPPSRAHAYLRHMASAPNMQTNTIRRVQSVRTASAGQRQANNRQEPGGEPPLPPTWLQTVAKAVLFGGEGTHMGGPQPGPLPPPSSRRQSAAQHAPIKSSRLSHSVVNTDLLQPPTLTDSTNRSSFLSVEADGKMRVGRALRCESQVTHTAVVCRSAPASRAGSRVRGGQGARSRRQEQEVLDVAAMMDQLVKDDTQRQGRSRWQSKSSKKSRRDHLPSLARTQTVGDSWSPARQEMLRHASLGHATGRRYATIGAGASTSHQDDVDDDLNAIDSDESDEGPELNLAQLLVPPKRQNSIRSLRKHLDSGSKYTYRSQRTHVPRNSIDGADGGVEEDSEDYLEWGRELRKPATGKGRRGGIPGWHPSS